MKGTLQIVFGLLCTAAGCPLAVEVFEGSTSDPKTVAAQVDKIRNRFGLRRVVLVGDRGMLTRARIREDLQGIDGLRWITTLRAPTIRKLIANGQVAQSMFDERDLAEISSPDFPGERLIVCRNPLLAEQRQRKRQELLAATEEKLAPIVRATQRAKDPLRGAAQIGMRVGKVINQHKVGKHFSTVIAEDSFKFQRDREKIAAEEELDGLYIVRSNVEPELFDAEQTVRAYKDLSKVERAFRSMKTVDLKVRPIYHRSAQRVRAHVLLCMLAYYVEWHMRSALAPVLFDDHDPQAAQQQRSSVVQPAQRSPAAQQKAASKRTADDLPVHSFRSLISELGTQGDRKHGARDLEKIATEEELDGLYIVRSNVEPELFDAEQTVTAYQDLAKVERAFRSMKTVDLKVRPIYHRNADRVRAHVFLCLLAYYVEWHLRQKLAPVLFDDHDRAAGEQLRESVVQPAQRSPAAHRKAASKRTDDGLPVHSFRGLMSELGTLTANSVRMVDSGTTFTMHSEPTALQQRCFDLLGVSPQV